MRRSVAALTAGIAVVLSVVIPPAPGIAQPVCEPRHTPSFSEGASEPGVVGVVERETVATNPMPWGASISVATRIWGEVQTERWKLSDPRFVTCADDPPDEIGWMEYDFRGFGADWGDVLPFITLPDELTPEDRLILETRFGPAESFPVTGVDRTMATVRVFGVELVVLVVVGVLAVTSGLRRRRRRRDDRHLF